MKFSDRYLRGLKPRTPGYAVLESSGLMLTVSPTGFKTFYFRFNIDGKRQKIRIGKFPALTLSDARKHASTHANKVANHIHPIAEIRELQLQSG